MTLLRDDQLLDDPGNQVQAVFDGRRDRLEQCMLVRLGDCVRAQPGDHILRMGHGLDAGGVDGLHFLDQAENTAQLIENLGTFSVGDFNARQHGYALYVVQG